MTKANSNGASKIVIKSDFNSNTVKPTPTKLTNYHFVEDFGIVWKNVIVFGLGHLLYLYACYDAIVNYSPTLNFWNFFLLVWNGLGIGCGAHRLWTHRAYKARLPLRVFLAIGQSIAGQNCIYIWARDHRIHHKYSDTDADPHNVRRGFFFCHVGWLMTKKHPEVKEKGQKIDLSDLRADPVVNFQERYYYPIFIIFAILIPTYVPVYLWGESAKSAFLLCFIFRMTTSLHATWCVNSAAHMFGDRPYDGKIPPAENSMVSLMTLGEGYHNYHHKFPYDYATSELGHTFNVSKLFIELMAFMGQAYDLKRVTRETIDKMKEKTKIERETIFYF